MVDITYALAKSGVYGLQNGAYQDTLIPMVDSFEDGDLAEYTGDTGAAGTTIEDDGGLAFSAKDGSNLLHLNGELELQSAEGGGLENYFAKGQQISWWQRPVATNGLFAGLCFRANGTDFFHAGIDVGDNALWMRDFHDGVTLDVNFDGNFATGNWYRGQVSIGDGATDFGGNVGVLNDDQIDFRVFNNDGTQNAATPIVVTDATASTTNGIGWYHHNGTEDVYYDYAYLSQV